MNPLLMYSIWIEYQLESSDFYTEYFHLQGRFTCIFQLQRATLFYFLKQWKNVYMDLVMVLHVAGVVFHLFFLLPLFLTGFTGFTG